MKKDKNEELQKTGKKGTSIVRSSAAEYLTFVAATGEGGVETVYADENIWLTQKMMATLYNVERSNRDGPSKMTNWRGVRLKTGVFFGLKPMFSKPKSAF